MEYSLYNRDSQGKTKAYYSLLLNKLKLAPNLHYYM